jgi:hypothetical protein
VDRRVACLAAGFVYLSVSTSPLAQMAQPTGAPEAARIDPPETEYRAGTQDPDPMAERRLPVVPAYKAYLPVTADLADHMPPVGNQENSPSSAAWAVAYAARGYYTAALEGRDTRDPRNLASPGYVYHLARQGACEDGTSVTRIGEVLRRGAVSLADDPFRPDCVPPAAPAIVATAHDFRIQGLHRVDIKRADDIKGALVRGQPVIVELRVSPAFKRLRGEATFTEPEFDPQKFDPNNKDNGRQFVTLTGYDERRQAFRLVNSWGTGWGDRGYAWLGYDAFANRVTRAYMLDVAPPKPQQPPSGTPGASASATKPDLTDIQALPCAHVDVEPDGERRVLAGHVATEADLRRLGAIATNVPGVTVRAVDIVPWPLCEVLETLAKLLAAPDPPKITVAKTELRSGDNLAIVVVAPARPSHLYVSYIQADGSIVHLARPKGATAEPTAPGATLKYGDGRDGRPRFLISQPFGREMIIVMASRAPFAEDGAATRQPARDYLSALRRQLMHPRSPEPGNGEVGAAMKILKTQAR